MEEDNTGMSFFLNEQNSKEKENKTIIKKGINYLFVYNQNKIMIIDRFFPFKLREDLEDHTIIECFNKNSDNIIFFKEDDKGLSQDHIENARKQFEEFDRVRTTNINEAKKSYNNYKKNIGLLIGGIILLMIIIFSFFK